MTHQYPKVTPENPLLLIYHADCPDGFACAVIACGALGMSSVQLLAADHGDEPPPVAGQDVLICDFSWPRNVVERMASEARSLIVLDHHATAKEALAGLPYCVFDESHSGAWLAWAFFHPHHKPPHWVNLIEDRDLWKGKYGEATEQFGCYMWAEPRTISAWVRVLSSLSEKMNTVLTEGAAILRAQQAHVRTIAEQATVDEWPFDVPEDAVPDLPPESLTVAHLSTPIYASEVCQEMLKRHSQADFAVTYFRKSNGVWVHELRTRPGSGPHVGRIARRFRGGGGHPDAAGFDHPAPAVRDY